MTVVDSMCSVCPRGYFAGSDLLPLKCFMCFARVDRLAQPISKEQFDKLTIVERRNLPLKAKGQGA
jgi:hypothetical protein